MKLPNTIAASAATLLLQAGVTHAAANHQLWMDLSPGPFNSRTNASAHTVTSGCKSADGVFGGSISTLSDSSFVARPSSFDYRSLLQVITSDFQIYCCTEVRHSESTVTEEYYYGKCLKGADPTIVIAPCTENGIAGVARPYWIMGGTVTTRVYKDNVLQSTTTTPSTKIATTHNYFLRAVQGAEHFQTTYDEHVDTDGCFRDTVGGYVWDFKAETTQWLKKIAPSGQFEAGRWKHVPTTELGIPHSTVTVADPITPIPDTPLRSPGVRVASTIPVYGDKSSSFSQLESLVWSNPGTPPE
jgi:hypothetical protein